MDDDPDWRDFQKMNADVGVEMNVEEAKSNYAACMIGLVMVEEGHSIEKAISMIMDFDARIHPGVLKKFLVEAEKIE